MDGCTEAYHYIGSSCQSCNCLLVELTHGSSAITSAQTFKKNLTVKSLIFGFITFRWRDECFSQFLLSPRWLLGCLVGWLVLTALLAQKGYIVP